MADAFGLLAEEVSNLGSQPLELCAQSFEDFASCGGHLQAVERVLKVLTQDIDDAGFSTNGKFIPLDLHNDVSLALVRYVKPTHNILWGDEDYLQIQLSEGACEIGRYAFSRQFDESVFDPTLSLTKLSQIASRRGTLLTKSPDKVIDVIPRSQTPIHFLRLTRQTEGNFEWAFTRSDGSAHSMITKRQSESNLLAIMDLLSQVGDDKSLGLLQKLMTHDLHFVRWRALQAAVHLDPKNGLIYLSPFLEDRHPEIREAANQTKRLLSEMETEHAA